MANKTGTKEKKSSRLRINLLDAVLVLLAILCVVGIWQRKNLQKLFSDEQVMEAYTVTFEVKKLRSSTVALLQKETALYLIDGSEVPLGTLTETVSTTAAIDYFTDEDGKVVSAVYPQDQYEYLLDVTGVLRCRGLRRDGVFLLEGKTPLALGQTIDAYTENADITICIVGIETAS